MKRINRGSIKHKLGNVISGFITIIDGIVLIISLGNYSLGLTLMWNIHRKTNKFLVDL